MSYIEEKFKGYNLFLQIEDMYKNFNEEKSFFDEEILPKNPESFSFYNNYVKHFSNMFLIACANSYEQFFENKFPSVFGFVPDSVHYNFLISQALKRKYFTMFDWDTNNANKFYKLFGEEFKEFMVQYRKDEKDFLELEKAFLELGKRRNIMVHQGLKATGQIQDVSYIYGLFQKSLSFCHIVFSELNKWLCR